ncbi:MAG: 30S ribosomal protein S4 [Candidatus Saccharicenans sp.]|jgi:small subunit ribosomal protein S4|nr:30S ribosomal protein S4 [Candidatus Saccharicenans sp.]MDH7493848.1 30S ribosomal protein S4 [Candidatus Saccharicenans sp.]
MARYQKPDCRLCRIEKTKLFLKGNKCLTDKCPLERRPFAPGQHGRMRKRVLGYALQLREKQKLKRYYCMSEQQFRLFFKRAEQQKGVTGENLLVMLERRLDNVVFLMGLAQSRSHARQMITHGHVLVNDHKVTVPSYLVKAGDVVALKEKSAQNENFRAVVEANKTKTLPGWLQVDWDNCRGTVVALPTRQDVTIPVEEHLVVELYSK